MEYREPYNENILVLILFKWSGGTLGLGGCEGEHLGQVVYRQPLKKDPNNQ